MKKEAILISKREQDSKNTWERRLHQLGQGYLPQGLCIQNPLAQGEDLLPGSLLTCTN